MHVEHRMPNVEVPPSCDVMDERNRVEAALRESEERLRRVSDNANVGLTRLSRDWIYLSANPAYAEIAGKPLDQIVGRPMVEVLGAAGVETIRPYVERALRGEHVTYEARVPFVGAGQRYLHVSYTPDTDSVGQIVGWVACVTDITARKKDEEVLREREEQLELIIRHYPGMVARVDHDLRYRYASPRYEEWFGMAPSAVLGLTIADVIGPQAFARAEPFAKRALAGEQVTFENQIALSSGRSWWVMATFVPVADADGTVMGFFIFATDITERKQAGESLQKLNESLEQRTGELHEQSEWLRAILNTAADAIITIDRKGTIQGINPATERMFGYASEELLGQNVKVLMPPPFRDEHDGYLARYLETGQTRIIGIGREVSGRRKDGSIFPVDLAVSEIDHMGLFTGVLRDISERKELQRQVLEISVNEQRRIGQELHDGTQQELTGLSLIAGTLLDVLKSIPEERTDAHSTWHFGQATYSRLADFCMKLNQGLANANLNVRQLSHGILPAQIDAHGLRSALEELAATTNELSRIDCRFECHQPVAVANNTVATNLYRVAQEAVTNALRHSHATNITISLTRTDGHLELIVRDNGVGFDPSSIATQSANSNHHMGLRIMDYRANLIGGTLRIGRAEPSGTIVRCLVPHGMTE